jgi:exodeoxyribonuclease VII large subunit
VIVEGEVASFKVNQGKWVFFDLKDREASVSCFMPLFGLRHPLADGMMIRVQARPKLTKWGKFSLTVEKIIPVGEGSIKKSLDLLRGKLEKEGLFDAAKKRPISNTVERIAVISSMGAAGYQDFLKIVENRWAGLQIEVYHTQVQGMGAADQIMEGLKYLNEHSEAEVVAIIRGGGSADDLAIFNDEALVRAIAASRIPVVTGIGHEVDTTLADLAADRRASTPSNAAEVLTRDRKAVVAEFGPALASAATSVVGRVEAVQKELLNDLRGVQGALLNHITAAAGRLDTYLTALEALNPETVLARGYALMGLDKGSNLKKGSVVKITTMKNIIEAEVLDVKPR